MFTDKWNKLYAPDVEGGTPEAEEGAPPPAPRERVPLNERPVSGPGSARGSIRESLENAAAAVRERDTPPKDEKTGKFVRGKSRAAAGADVEEEPEPTPAPAEGEEPAPTLAEPPAEPEPAPAPATPPPEGWSKEAKAEWAKVPAAVQAAVSKREQDVNKGVQELRQRYSDIDQALAPRMDVIRAHGHTPAQAVNQLFSWFEALNNNPTVAFPALAQSFRFDLKSLLEAAPAAPAAPAEGGQPEGEVPPAVQAYIKSIEQKLGGMEQAIVQRFGALENTFAQQSQAKTEEILAHWAKDKPHYEEVRNLMAHLIGSGAVEALPDGRADLDKAYDMALYANPQVRTQLLASQTQAAEKARKDRETAEKTAQQALADKARKTSVSLSPGAPGAVAAVGKPKGKGKSVKESLMDSITELSE